MKNIITLKTLNKARDVRDRREDLMHKSKIAEDFLLLSRMQKKDPEIRAI